MVCGNSHDPGQRSGLAAELVVALDNLDEDVVHRILGIGDCPQIDCVLTSLDSGHNNAGMMGLGEPVTVPTAGAVTNAVSHALGVRMTEIPITPARVLAALGGAR